MKALVKRLLKDESGQGLAEYGLILGLIAVLLVGALIFMREELDRIFTYIGTKLKEVSTS